MLCSRTLCCFLFVELDRDCHPNSFLLQLRAGRRITVKPPKKVFSLFSSRGQYENDWISFQFSKFPDLFWGFFQERLESNLAVGSVLKKKGISSSYLEFVLLFETINCVNNAANLYDFSRGKRSCPG